MRPNQTLQIRGWANNEMLVKGPLHLALTVDECEEPVKIIEKKNSDFHFEYALPAAMIGRPRIKVTFTLDRTIRVPTDMRDLGLLFGRISIR